GPIRNPAHQRRHFLQSRTLRRAPPPFTSDQLIAASIDRPHEYRLHDPLCLDRLRELSEGMLVHVRAGLILSDADAIDRKRLQRFVARGFVGAGKKRIESATESL